MSEFKGINLEEFKGSDEENYQKLLSDYETNLDTVTFKKVLSDYNTANPTAPLTAWQAILSDKEALKVRPRVKAAASELNSPLTKTPAEAVALSPFIAARAYVLDELEKGGKADFESWSDDDVKRALNDAGGFKILNEAGEIRKKLRNKAAGEYLAELDGIVGDEREKFFFNKRAENENENTLRVLSDFDLALRQLNLNELTSLFNVGGKRDEKVKSNLQELIKKGDSLGLELQVGDDANLYFRRKGDLNAPYALFDKEKFQGFLDDFVSNAGKIIGGAVGAGAMSLASPLAMFAGSMIGTAIGGAVDNFIAAHKTGKDKLSNALNDVINDLALGAVGEGVAKIGATPLVKGVRRLGKIVGVGEYAKNWATKTNPAAVEEIITQRLAPQDAARAAQKAGIEFEPTGVSKFASKFYSPLGGAVNDLSGAAAQDARVLNAVLSDTSGKYATAVGESLMKDTGAIMKAREFAARVFKETSPAFEKNSVNSGEMIDVLKGAVDKLEKEYAEKLASFDARAVKFEKKAVKKQLDELTKKVTNRLLESEAAPVKSLKEDVYKFITKKEALELDDLNNLRAAINRIYAEGTPEMKYFANLVREEIYEPSIKLSLGESAPLLEKELARYAEMLDAKSMQTFKSLTDANKNTASYQTALNDLLLSKTGEANQFSRIQKFLDEKDLGKFETSVLKEQIRRFTTDYGEGTKVLDSVGLIKKLGELDVSFKSREAKELLNFIGKYNADFGGLAPLIKAAKSPKLNTEFNTISPNPLNAIAYKLSRASGSGMIGSLPTDSAVLKTINWATKRLGEDFLQRAGDISTQNSAIRGFNRNIISLGKIGANAAPKRSFAQKAKQSVSKKGKTIYKMFENARHGGLYTFANLLGSAAQNEAEGDFLQREIFELQNQKERR